MNVSGFLAIYAWKSKIAELFMFLRLDSHMITFYKRSIAVVGPNVRVITIMVEEVVHDRTVLFLL